MADKAMDNNQVTIVGTVDSEFTYSHEVFGEGFYMLEVVVSRLSHMEDRIPLMVSGEVGGCEGKLYGEDCRSPWTVSFL